jgi:hypothetical protein
VPPAKAARYGAATSSHDIWSAARDPLLKIIDAGKNA